MTDNYIIQYLACEWLIVHSSELYSYYGGIEGARGNNDNINEYQ